MKYKPFMMTALTELSFGLPGHIFRSPMPFSSYDPHKELFDKYQQENITAVVMLVGDQDCLNRCRRDLRTFYTENGMDVIYLPIADFGLPHEQDLNQALNTTLQFVQEGRNIAVHCYAGVGRTGLFLAFLAKRTLGLSGEEAVRWVRQAIPHAVETREQYEMVVNFNGWDEG